MRKLQGDLKTECAFFLLDMLFGHSHLALQSHESVAVALVAWARAVLTSALARLLRATLATRTRSAGRGKAGPPVLTRISAYCAVVS